MELAKKIQINSKLEFEHFVYIIKITVETATYFKKCIFQVLKTVMALARN